MIESIAATRDPAFSLLGLIIIIPLLCLVRVAPSWDSLLAHMQDSSWPVIAAGSHSTARALIDRASNFDDRDLAIRANVLQRSLQRRRNRTLQPDSLHLAQCDLVLCPVVELGCSRRLMASHLLRVLEPPIVFQINRDAGGPPSVTSDRRQKTPHAL